MDLRSSLTSMISVVKPRFSSAVATANSASSVFSGCFRSASYTTGMKPRCGRSPRSLAIYSSPSLAADYTTRSYNEPVTPSYPPMSASLIGRPGVKHVRLSNDCGVDVAHGLVLLSESAPPALASSEFENEAEQSFGGGLAVRTTAGPSGHTILTSSVVPRGTSFHCSGSWNSEFPPIALIPHRSHAAATSRVQRNSVPSTQMRCIITANRRAKATIAFFSPRRLAIFIAQALSHDHLPNAPA